MTCAGDASYLEEYRIDVSKLEPLVAAPHSPDNRKTAHECSSTKIDRVYIGCAVAAERYCDCYRDLELDSGSSTSQITNAARVEYDHRLNSLC